ncbi:conserved hypothetical protein [Paraburkholderia sacchari]|uniref:T6SS immunity protein Tli3 family protein n=1 Tax=Paraburkholderia sacchari TaxID=159450 RepID=UPI0039A4C8E9
MATKGIRCAVIAAALLAMLQGCTEKKSDQPYMFMLSDFMAAKELPYDSPPQVIYRIDEHRFVTLERYRDCNYGETWYNDTRAKIRQKLGRGGYEDYQGKLINADPTGRNLVFPSSAPPGLVTNERGVSVYLAYSTDGGTTFNSLEYMPHSFDPFEDSKQYWVAVDNQRIYVKKVRQYDSYVVSYPLIQGFDYLGNKPLPDGIEIEFDTTMPSWLHTPSGDDHIRCDVSIKPTNPDAPLIRGDQ